MSADPPPLAFNPWRSRCSPRSTEVAARMMMKGRPRKGASSLETDRPRPLAGRQKGRRGSRQRGRRCSWRCARPSILGGTDRPRWRSVSALLHSRCWGDGPRPPSWLEPRARTGRAAAAAVAEGKGCARGRHRKGREAEESYARGRSLVCRTIGVGAPHSLSLGSARSCCELHSIFGRGRPRTDALQRGQLDLHLKEGTDGFD